MRHQSVTQKLMGQQWLAGECSGRELPAGSEQLVSLVSVFWIASQDSLNFLVRFLQTEAKCAQGFKSACILVPLSHLGATTVYLGHLKNSKVSSSTFNKSCSTSFLESLFYKKIC